MDRKRTIPIGTLEEIREELPEWLSDALALERPKTRGECVGGPRPCPWAACRHNNYLEVSSSGGLGTAHRVGIEDLKDSCSLDVADRGDSTLEEVGAALGVTRERVRQVEAKALDGLSWRDKERLLDLLPESSAVVALRGSGGTC